VSAANGDNLHLLVRHFRILKGWKVRLVPAGQLEGRVSFCPKTKKAVIYDCRGERGPHFLLHEVLHVCMVALWTMDKRKPKEIGQAEELLVRDICAIMPKEDK